MLSQLLDRLRLRYAGETVDNPEPPGAADTSFFLQFLYQLLDLFPGTGGLLLQHRRDLLAVLRTRSITILFAKGLIVTRLTEKLVLHPNENQSIGIFLQRQGVVDLGSIHLLCVGKGSQNKKNSQEWQAEKSSHRKKTYFAIGEGFFKGTNSK